MRITHQDTAAILSHSRAIGAPKREVPRFTGYELCKPETRAVTFEVAGNPQLQEVMNDMQRIAQDVTGIPDGAAAPPFKVGDRVRARRTERTALNNYVGAGDVGTVASFDSDGDIWIDWDKSPTVYENGNGPDCRRWTTPLQNLEHITDKPVAKWVRLSDVPESERGGLWHFDNTNYAGEPHAADAFPYGLIRISNARVLRCAPGVKPGDAYDASLYVQPDAEGWFAHEPKPDSVCQVPAWVGDRFEARMSCGVVPGFGNAYAQELRHSHWWRSNMRNIVITAWRPLP